MQDNNNSVKLAEQSVEIEQIIKRLDMLNHRLDSMDSVVTSLVERVMGRPLTMEVTCPNCGEIVQVNITSGVRLHGKG